MANVIVLGASPNPERFAYRAAKLLKEYGHEVFLVNPGHDEIDGDHCYRSAPAVLEDVDDIDTITMYVGPRQSGALYKDIVAVNPRRVIFNPGAENPELQAKLEVKDILVVNDCTLVMLNSMTF